MYHLLLLFLKCKGDGSEVGFFEVDSKSDVHQRGAMYRQVALGNIVKLVFIKSLHDDAIAVRVAMVEASVAGQMRLRLILGNDGEGKIIVLEGVIKSVEIALQHKMLHLFVLLDLVFHSLFVGICEHSCVKLIACSAKVCDITASFHRRRSAYLMVGNCGNVAAH